MEEILFHDRNTLGGLDIPFGWSNAIRKIIFYNYFLISWLSKIMFYKIIKIAPDY